MAIVENEGVFGPKRVNHRPKFHVSWFLYILLISRVMSCHVIFFFILLTEKKWGLYLTNLIGTLFPSIARESIIFGILDM